MQGLGVQVVHPLAQPPEGSLPTPMAVPDGKFERLCGHLLPRAPPPPAPSKEEASPRVRGCQVQVASPRCQPS